MEKKRNSVDEDSNQRLLGQELAHSTKVKV